MTRYHCLNKKKKESKYVNLEEKDLNFFINSSVLEDYSATNTEEIIEGVFEELDKLEDKRISRIFKLRYLSGRKRLTWREIARQFELTPQTIINLHKKGKKFLQKRFDKR
jgi:RNA polymerase sigma factor (sigma-70 family)